ncbi:MAG: hypothetical protein EPN93_07405 [Spirochaetes bacterium]|nr:MAG: hypothetical protein EPN93_07405 [Spirochaetota bacterium]
MRRLICIVLLCALGTAAGGCGQKAEKNKVDIDQFEADRSNNYRYIFRDLVEKEKAEEKKEHKRQDPFKK